MAHFSYPVGAAPASFRTSISWGDGSTTTGTVQFAGIPIQGGLEWFVVEGSHTCRTRSVRRAQITVTKTGGVHATGTANVSVERWDPTAFFYFNPDNPTNGDIAMVVPHPPLPYQRPIDTYEWQFTDGNPVIDSPKTRPLYMRVLHALASDPGSLAAEGQAEVLGILPPGFSEGASVAQSVANVWLQYFPRHMVPHIYPDARNVRVTLTVTDSAGKKDTIAKDVHVSDHCLEWGGPLSFLFGNTNTCETWNGFQAVAGGPARRPDYYAFDLSAPVGAGLVGMTLTVTHDGDVFLALHGTVGLSVKSVFGTGVSDAEGFVGPPDGNPPPDGAIDNFVGGLTIPVQAALGPLGLTLVLSPGTGAGGRNTG